MNNLYTPTYYYNNYRQINDNFDNLNNFDLEDNDERFGGFALPFLAGLAVTAPFWGGGFYGRRCCGYARPYPVPYPYPYPYPYPTPYYRRPYIY